MFEINEHIKVPSGTSATEELKNHNRALCCAFSLLCGHLIPSKVVSFRHGSGWEMVTVDPDGN